MKVMRPAFFEIRRKCGKTAFDVVLDEPRVEEETSKPDCSLVTRALGGGADNL
jgi:hypothetical protein